MLHLTFGMVVEEEVVEGGVRREGMRAETVSLPREEAQGTWVVACVLGQVTLMGGSVQVGGCLSERLGTDFPKWKWTDWAKDAP